MTIEFFELDKIQEVFFLIIKSHPTTKSRRMTLEDMIIPI